MEAARRELRDTRNESEQARRMIEAGVKSPLGIGKLTAALTDNRDLNRGMKHEDHEAARGAVTGGGMRMRDAGT